MFNFIPFDTWLERNTDIERETECENCGGDGRYVCECEHCRGHECHECAGTGRIGNPAARKMSSREHASFLPSFFNASSR